MRACDVMTSPVVTVGPDTSMREAAALLVARGFTALPVVDGGDRLVGVVTEADIIRHQFSHGLPPALCIVREAMSAPVKVGPGTDVARLVRVLVGAGRRSMPVVDEDRVVGIVTCRDVVRVVGRDDAAIAREVRHQLETYGGCGRWRVAVHDGMVTVDDEFDDATDRHVAAVLAEAVPGVVRAQVTSRQAHEDRSR